MIRECPRCKADMPDMIDGWSNCTRCDYAVSPTSAAPMGSQMVLQPTKTEIERYNRRREKYSLVALHAMLGNEKHFGSPEKVAEFAVRYADALLSILEE